MVATDFRLEPLEVLTLAEQMKLYGDSFGKPVDEDWYRWKHVEGPWGPSTGLVAVDSGGPAAIFLCLPWQVRADEIRTVKRGVDSGTLPRAQRRGLFQAMSARWTADECAAGQPFNFCTANEPAARVHARAGATVLSFAHAYSVPFIANVGFAHFKSTPVSEAVAMYMPDAPEGAGVIATNWGAASLAWRFDKRSGLVYRAAILARGRASAGLIYRLETRKGVRVLIRTIIWGATADRARLTAAVARSHMAPVLLDLTGRGPKPRVSRGTSLVCAWSHSEASSLRPTELGGWDLTLADLEGVI